MATQYVTLAPLSAYFRSASFPQVVRSAGSSTQPPVEGLAFDAGLDEEAHWRFDALRYGAGNLTIRIRWYADTASSGVVRWGASLAAITPNTDTTDIEAKSYATEQTDDDTHLGTTGQREHESVITLSNLDSLAALDSTWLRVRRIGSNGADTMSGDAILTAVIVEYSDT